MEIPSFPIAVVMQRRPAKSRWADFVWEPFGVVAAYAGTETKVLRDNEGVLHMLHGGFKLELHRDECEGYYLNVSSADPRVFVLWRMDEDHALPLHVTVSSEEAGRWMDGGHSVDSVTMPSEIFAWTGDYVEKNYRPEPQKRIKPKSFQHPKYRV